MGIPVESASIAEQLFAAYNDHQLDIVSQHYADDASHEDVAHGRPKIGAAAIADGLRKFLGWFPDAAWEVTSRIVGQGDEVAVAYTLTGTLKTQMGPVTPRGQRISLRGIQVLKITNGKIQRSEDYWDATTFHKQLNFNTQEERS
ncbi:MULTISPECIES: ester cyclase [unclassified Sinorhizobium]|uniref:nuclear transport factor 2 family protein n=1 Tax=unclassified Sinorhizobium TaxID=2613772 RepID=UPI0024C2BAC3|nr:MULTISPECIES: ester cyclase [unclassified Sinorhizobium]MDK1376822.1 ester cyclase [Sinorhizobium sp. 6-70]MDK1481077.1 ester cyclase [Sinorhizobium sp. 6-117]